MMLKVNKCLYFGQMEYNLWKTLGEHSDILPPDGVSISVIFIGESVGPRTKSIPMVWHIDIHLSHHSTIFNSNKSIYKTEMILTEMQLGMCVLWWKDLISREQTKLTSKILDKLQDPCKCQSKSEKLLTDLTMNPKYFQSYSCSSIRQESIGNKFIYLLWPLLI